jgi:RNA polymerase sigma-70 factor (ECF subfamily)
MPTGTSAAQPASPDQVIERACAGDEAAWDTIVRLYWRKVFNVAYRFVGSHHEAEDLTQDIFLKVFRSLCTFDRRANFQTWLISVSRNLCIDHYRTKRREHETIDHGIDASELSPASTGSSPYAVLEGQDRISLLREGLQALSPTLRSAVLLRDLHELSYQEVADQLGLAPGTVKSRINRGRAELARHLRRIRQRQEVGGARGAGALPAGRSMRRRPTGVAK